MRNWIRGHRWLALVLCLAIVISAMLIITGLHKPATASEDAMLNQFLRIDRAVDAVLDDEWHRASMTKVTPTQYQDADGHTITYYLCHTAYTESAEVADQDGLNTMAFSGIIDSEDADSERICDVREMPAVVYEKDGLAYLCWTDTPEYSFVLEYDPNVTAETEIFKMAESIPRVSET